MMYNHILIRYGELSLKKANRNQFIKLVNNHIKKALSIFTKLQFESDYMRFYVILNGEDADAVVEVLKTIPGIYSFSKVSKCESNLEEIKALALNTLKNLDLTNKTFKVETNRANKNFTMTSLEITKEISRHLFRNIDNLKADVHNPDITINVDVRLEGTFIYTESIYGMGGLPSSSLGKAMLMISGGIDSVVAGLEVVRRGMDIEAIHYASPPYTSDMALQKVVDLLQVITKYKSDCKILLHVVPFTNIQKSIYENVRDDYGITIMRRMMYRIAERVAKKQKALTIVNGENIGQVASQTLESISVINNVTNMPIIRPLATLDKKDIIEKAIKYGTYDISIRPYEDCCTVFVPKHPQIKPRLDVAVDLENKFDYESLIDEAINNIQHIVLTSNTKYQVIKTEEEDIF
ncbi:MAG: tRNA 4-thiouridine(8) synthase ThiI [Bacilli bacterium]|nr:tRNA 4-thiouridine(8) synthase ThiI [Bacilli bacterium]